MENNEKECLDCRCGNRTIQAICRVSSLLQANKDTLKQELEVQRIQVLRTTVLPKQVFTQGRFKHLPLGKVQFPTNVQGQ